jgi:hypothetical protein
MPIFKLPKKAFIPLDLPPDIPAQHISPKRMIKVLKPTREVEPVPEVQETTQEVTLPKTHGMTKARALEILGGTK